MKSTRIVKSAFALAIAGVIAGGMFAATASAARPRPGGCICPDVYAPVLCPNGQVYSNSCQAGCAGQRNCVPYGGKTK